MQQVRARQVARAARDHITPADHPGPRQARILVVDLRAEPGNELLHAMPVDGDQPRPEQPPVSGRDAEPRASRSGSRSCYWVPDPLPAGSAAGSGSGTARRRSVNRRGGRVPAGIAPSLMPTTERRPSASAARNTMTTPRPVKKPICSTTRVRVPPTGVPTIRPDPAQARPMMAPRANHAPLIAANQAPNIATGRLALASTIRPPTRAPAPGRISSQSRPDV